MYCHYPKSYQKLEWHKICSNLPLVDRNDTSDEELPSFIHTVTSVNKKKNTKVVDSLVDSDMQVPPTGNLLHEISGQEIHHDNTIGESITCLHLSAIARLMILILTMSVKYMVNHLSILEAFVQNVPVRILGNRVFAVSKMQSMVQV